MVKLAQLKGKKSLLDGVSPQAMKDISDLIFKYIQNEDPTKAELYYKRLMTSIERARRDKKAREITLEARGLLKNTQSPENGSENK